MVKHSRDISFIAATVYFCQGALGISSIALPLYLRSLGWSVAEIAATTAIAALPWIFKILYGLTSDFLPLFGLRRKPYLIMASLITSAGWVLMSMLPQEKEWVLGAMILSNLGFAATDVITDALVVEHSAGISSSIYQSIAWGSRSLGAFIAGIAAGWLAEHWMPGRIFLMTATLPFIVTIAATSILEKKAERGIFISAWDPVKNSFGLLLGNQLRYFTVILFLAAISSSFAVPFFFYMKETLGFSETFLGFLTSLGWGGAALGSFIYARWLRNNSPKKLLTWVIMINALNILSNFFISGHRSALLLIFFSGVMGCLVMLPIMSSAAALTHRSGVEGTLFAVLMSIFNLGQILFGYLGASVLNYTGLHFLIALCGVIALCGLIFVRKLRFEEVP